MTKTTSLLLMFLLSFSSISFSQEVWKQTSLKNGTELKKNKNHLPESTEFFTIDLTALTAKVAEAPRRGHGNGVEISLPGVGGKMTTFEVVEAPNFSPVLQAKFPNIKSYRGTSKTNRHLSVNLSVSHKGMQAMISGPDFKTTFIEPISVDNNIYASYHKLAKNGKDTFECLTEEDNTLYEETYDEALRNSLNANDQTLRTFRLVVSVTGEYTAYHGGTVADAMAAINATMTRVNGVFERDLAINMELIGNNEDVIYTNAATDPYSDAAIGADGAWNEELEDNLIAVIGESNYDVGHLFGATGGGGNAGCIGCVCDSKTSLDNGKGSGYTSPADGVPEGDFFDIDYVAHELGHQFGANHTFSRSENTGANREPGSGSTIMGYAGITPANVQQNSDDLFHYYSIYQVTTNMASKTCPVETSISNNPPTANAGANYTIPSGTPFKLTASASDPDGDPITYSWEQADNSNANAFIYPSATATTGPLFRAKQMTTSPTRYFPAFDLVLNGDLASAWEPLPTVSRSLNFVVQVRDNNAGIGQTASDNMQVSVDASNGAFEITNFSENESLTPGQTYNMTWNVAGTTTAPFNSPTVNILMSLDGGENFTMVAAGTANDGSQDVTIPIDALTNGAYFMIESIGNIFYTVSPKLLVGYTSETVCNTYNGSPTSVTIPDGTGAYAATFFSVPDFGEISDINLTLNVSHTYISDLQIVLQAPDGSQISVWNRECAGQNNFNITFDDSGSPITCSNQNTTGIFMPSAPLSTFNGYNTAGSWAVGARDVATPDGGTLNNAVIEICTTTEFLSVTPTNDVSLESSVTVHPNPAENLININFTNNSGKAGYQLFDLLGRKVLEINNTLERTIDISQLPSGMYLLEIAANGSKVTKKIIKN